MGLLFRGLKHVRRHRTLLPRFLAALFLLSRIGSLKSLSLGVDAGGIGKQVALSPFVEPSSIFPNAGSKLAPFLRPFEVLSHLLSPDRRLPYCGVSAETLPRITILLSGSLRGPNAAARGLVPKVGSL